MLQAIEKNMLLGNRRKTASILFLIVLLLSSFDIAGASTTEKESHRILEAYPNHIRKKLEDRARALPEKIDDMNAQYVIRTARRWKPGTTVKIAFRGGSSDLRRDISIAASEWTQYGNIIFDFGFNPQNGKYREWSPSDKQYVAEIRISFNARDLWSMIGNDSVNPDYVSPGQPSMNFESFDIKKPKWWKQVVLHEFGHALGFEHEHQHPEGGCNLEFRWEDDDGYIPTVNDDDAYISDANGRKPGVYTVLGGRPDCWSKPKVNFALKQLDQDSDAFDTGLFDKASIMKYYFEEWMFKSGKDSRCYNKENVILSSEDKKGMLKAYPRDGQLIAQAIKTQIKALNALVSLPAFMPETKKQYEKQLKSLQE